MKIVSKDAEQAVVTLYAHYTPVLQAVLVKPGAHPYQHKHFYLDHTVLLEDLRVDPRFDLFLV